MKADSILESVDEAGVNVDADVKKIYAEIRASKREARSFDLDEWDTLCEAAGFRNLSVILKDLDDAMDKNRRLGRSPAGSRSRSPRMSGQRSIIIEREKRIDEAPISKDDSIRLDELIRGRKTNTIEIDDEKLLLTCMGNTINSMPCGGRDLNNVSM